MKTVKTTVTTEAFFSDDDTKRFLLRKSWDDSKPKLAIVMVFPSYANEIIQDTTTQLVVNNASALGFGSVNIVNLFAELDNTMRDEEDTDNLNAIVKTAKTADTVIYAAGVGKAKMKVFQNRQKQVLTALMPFENKLHCLCNKSGEARLQHPLSPAVRQWTLSPLKISELIETEPTATETKEPPKNKKAK